MEINDAIQTLQQFDRLDDYQTGEIIRLIKAQSELIETQGLVLAEVRRLNRMVDRACGLLEMSEDSRMDAVGWRKYLEEAAGND